MHDRSTVGYERLLSKNTSLPVRLIYPRLSGRPNGERDAVVSETYRARDPVSRGRGLFPKDCDRRESIWMTRS